MLHIKRTIQFGHLGMLSTHKMKLDTDKTRQSAFIAWSERNFKINKSRGWARYTKTNFKNWERVKFWVDGNPCSDINFIGEEHKHHELSFIFVNDLLYCQSGYALKKLIWYSRQVFSLRRIQRIWGDIQWECHMPPHSLQICIKEVINLTSFSLIRRR